MHDSVKHALHKFSTDRYLTVLTGAVILHTLWLPVFIYLSGKDFLGSIIADSVTILIDLTLILFHSKIRKIVSITIFLLCVSFFCLTQAITTRLVCGMEYVLIACIPGLFLLSKDEKTSRTYVITMNFILILSVAFITYLKLAVLPPEDIFDEKRQWFYVSSQVFYTVTIMALLVYGCLATDITMRRLKSKRVFLQKKMDYLAKHDYLTGLMNRRRTMEIFDDVKYEKLSSGTDYAIAIFDIDNFKKINDSWGHDAGDFILKTYSKTVWDYFKEPVRIGRWGGEEFLIVFPEIDENTIYELENARKSFSEKPVIYEGNEISVTATFGLSSSRNFTEPVDVLNDADENLYIGKQNGKNRLVVSEKF
jgi:diguanylate cyclase (GGDEF)-like protein